MGAKGNAAQAHPCPPAGLSQAEHQRLLAVIGPPTTTADLLLLVLAWTGIRLSEALALTPQAFRLDANVVAIYAFKHGHWLLMRAAPLPPDLMTALDRQFGLAAAQRDPQAASRRLWQLSRTTAWRHVKAAMAKAGIVGAQASPQGLRHGFAAGAAHREEARVAADRFARWSDPFAAPPPAPMKPPGQPPRPSGSGRR